MGRLSDAGGAVFEGQHLGGELIGPADRHLLAATPRAFTAPAGTRRIASQTLPTCLLVCVMLLLLPAPPGDHAET